MNRRFFVLVLVALCCLQSGCVGKHPFLMVQMCVENEQGIADFKATMKDLAESNGMEFFDGSAETQQSLTEMNVAPGYPIIHIASKGPENYNFGAGNMGLSAFEVSVGFSEGSNPQAARQFAESVVNALQQRWEVHAVPPGQGAFPRGDCPSKQLE